MSRTKALKRLGVSAVCAVMVFGVAPAFTAPASANHTTTAITLTPDTQSAPAGTCQQFTATVTFNNTSGTDTATVDVLADPRVNEDVDFCSLNSTGNPPNTTSTTPPANGTVVTNGGAGQSENAEFTVTSTNGSNTGSVTFGIISNQAGTIDVTAFLENTATSSGNGQPDATERQDTSVATFTQGGNAGVTQVDAEPETGSAVQGQQYQFTVTVRNAAGQPVPGVTPFFDVISGPDANIGPTACDAPTNQLGQTTCTLTGGGQAPGTDTIRVYVNQTDADNNPATADTNGADAGEPFDDITVAFGAPQAAGTTVDLTCASVRTTASGDACQNPVSENTEVFTALVRNAAGTAQAGVPVTFTFTQGGTVDNNNVPAGTADNETLTPRNCTTGADGTCTTTLNNPRVTEGETFTVTARVAVSSGSGNCTGDTNGVCDSATKTFATAPANTARVLTLTPETQTVNSGGVGALTATVTDRSGIPVPNVQVTFRENGTGRFTNGSDTFVGRTDSNGQVRAELTTTAGEAAGSTTVTATITGYFDNAGNFTARGPANNDDQCESTANNNAPATNGNQPGAPAGACSDTATVTFGATSPSPTATATATPTGTASPAPADCDVTPTVTLEFGTINATGSSGVTVTGAPANSQIELLAYSQPSTTYRVVRRATINNDGDAAQFRIVPPTNTRLYAQIVGCDTDEVRFSKVLNVRTQLSLNVERLRSMTYRFYGDSLPARPGGLIVSLYRVANDGRQILTAQTRADARNGEWSLVRTFTGTGRFGFVVRTGQDLQNAPGTSNVRSLLIF